jgi:hypothetical protein
MSVPNTFSNGVGNVPDADLLMANFTYLTTSPTLTSLSLSATSSQLTLGTTRTVTITAPTPASSSRTWTIPDITADGTFASLTGTQTFTGSKTFSAATLFSAVSATAISISAVSSGGTVGMLITNTSNTASSDARLVLEVGGTSGNDPYIQLSIPGSIAYAIGLDNSTTNDDFTISRGSTPGTNNALVIGGASGSVSIRGTSTNDNATALFVGEFIESSITSFTNAASTNTQGDLTSISLTAGDWDVSYAGQWTSNSATWTSAEFGFGTTSGNNAGLLAARQQDSWASTSTAVTDRSLSATYRMSISSTTTVYLKYKSVFSAGTPQAIGRISARRVR